jgi:uncharacterized protein YbbK (DUF523 family)
MTSKRPEYPEVDHEKPGVKILISACLLGQPVRYDGKANDGKVSHALPLLEQWRASGWLVPVCPEGLGGLPTPRPAAEISLGDGKTVLDQQANVITRSGDDVTAAFIAGANNTLAIARKHNACAALLAARSPSCGSDGIYNGQFTGQLREGMGVTAALLEQHGIRCFSPAQTDTLQEYLETVIRQNNADG